MTEAKTTRISPWRRAEALEACWLFWLPVNLPVTPEFQKEWLLQFLTRLCSRLKSLLELEEQEFMQLKVIDANSNLRKEFLNAMLKESPFIGMSRFPGQGEVPQPAMPSRKEAEAFVSGKQTFRPQDYIPDRACWFTGGGAAKLRQKYLGYGGMTILFLKPDESKDGGPPPVPPRPVIIPKVFRNDSRLKPMLDQYDFAQANSIPPFIKNHPGMKQVFSVFDVENIRTKPQKMGSPFCAKSKQVFGEDMEHDLSFEAQPFILPRLSSAHFFSHTSDQLRRWFEVFDVYVTESPADEGILMACKDNLTSLLEDVMEEMRTDGYHYWEG